MYKMKFYSNLMLVAICFIIGPTCAFAEKEALVSLLDRISERMNSHPKNPNYQVDVLSKEIEMNKQWEPEKTTIVKKIEKNIDGKVDSEILEATETENGKSTDVTEKIVEQDRKLKEKANHDYEKEPFEKETGNPWDEFFPFNELKRPEFDFYRLEDAVIDGRDFYVIEAKAKAKDEDRMEGKYYIDQKTLDILKIDVKPSKNPSIVKEIGMKIDFEVLPEGYFVMKKMKIKQYMKIVLKAIRSIVEVEYINYEILHVDNSR